MSQRNTSYMQKQPEQFRKGNFVKIIKYGNSVYNVYKGYVGEIKECYEHHAIVNLEADPSNKNINIPFEHLIRFYHTKYN